jgi:hypothetical protein
MAVAYNVVVRCVRALCWYLHTCDAGTAAHAAILCRYVVALDVARYVKVRNSRSMLLLSDDKVCHAASALWLSRFFHSNTNRTIDGVLLPPLTSPSTSVRPGGNDAGTAVLSHDAKCVQSRNSSAPFRACVFSYCVSTHCT